MRRQFIVFPLVAFLLIGTRIGCQPQPYSNTQGPANVLATTEAVGQNFGPGGQETTPRLVEKKLLRVFASESFYRERTEPEQRMIGVLRTSTVREGPNTRDMPLKLVTPLEELSVYMAGVDEHPLRQFVDQEVEVIGKRIDLHKEGYGVEIWIGTIAIVNNRDRSHSPCLWIRVGYHDWRPD